MSHGGRMFSRGGPGRHSNAAYADLDNSEGHSNGGHDRNFQRRRKMLGENTYRILIRESKVKVVLGPEGKHIQDMKSKCSEPCKITIYTQHADGEPFPRKSPDRILNLECSLVDLESVFLDLIPHLQVAAPELMMDKFNEIRLVVPEFVCSMIIGKQGINVKNIQREFRSFVQVHKDPLPHSTEYVVSLTNKDVSCLAASVCKIYESIRMYKCISHVTMFNPIEWYPGEFGDTGSYTEEINVRPRPRPQMQNQVYPEPEEPRYYREHPRFQEENRMHRRGANNGHSRINRYEDYDQSYNRPHNGRGNNMRARGFNPMRGQNVRGRNFHRGGRPNGNSRGMSLYHNRNEESRHSTERNDKFLEDTVVPRRPREFRDRN